MTSWIPDIKRRTGPRYLAITDALAEDVREGRLPAGTRLPTHRDLAEQVGVTVGTITRAYAEAARRGLVSGEVGRGTFVRGTARDDEPFLIAPADSPSVIDLSANFPVPGLNTREVREGLEAIASRGDLAALFAYHPTLGSSAHREAGAQWIARAGLETRPEQVIVCGGAQHAMMVTFAAITKPGDVVLTEELTYPGIKAIAALLRLRLQGLPMDGEGLIPGAFEAAARGGVARALYCMPSIHNPSGVSMPDARRRRIAAIAAANGVAVVEDDTYGFLLPDAPKPIASHAPDHGYYIVSFSKSVLPGLRLGFLHAPASRIRRITSVVWTVTPMVVPLMAELASGWIRDGTAARFTEMRRATARARMEIAVRILGRGAFEAHPNAYHLWLGLPEPWRTEEFVVQAHLRGVAVTPGGAFAVGRSTEPHAVRVCLGAVGEIDRLEQGLGILAGILQESPEPAMSII